MNNAYKQTQASIKYIYIQKCFKNIVYINKIKFEFN